MNQCLRVVAFAAVAALVGFAPSVVSALPRGFVRNAVAWRVFTPGNGFSTYYGIVRGPGLDVWVADNHDRLLLRIDPAGLAKSFSVPFSPNQMALGADDAFYVNSSSSSLIARVATSGATQTFPIPSGDLAFGGMALGPDDQKVWFTEQDHIASITPDGLITEYPLPGMGVAGGGVAAGGDGNVWFAGTIAGGPAMISKINPATGHIVTYPVPSGITCYPVALGTAPDGAIWFNCASSLGGGIGRIGPDGRYQVFPTEISPTFAPQSLAFAPDGSLWFVGAVYQKAVLGRFDPATHEMSPYYAPGGSNPQWGLTFDARGNIWTSSLSYQVDELLLGGPRGRR